MYYINKNCIDVIWMLILERYSVIISCRKKQRIVSLAQYNIQVHDVKVDSHYIIKLNSINRQLT